MYYKVKSYHTSKFVQSCTGKIGYVLREKYGQMNSDFPDRDDIWTLGNCVPKNKQI